MFFFFLMIRRPPRSTRTDTLFPYTTLFRSVWQKQQLLVVIVFRALFEMGDFFIQARTPGAEFAEVFFVRRSEEHTSELQSLMRISYAVFCLKKKKKILQIKKKHYINKQIKHEI